MPSSESLLPLMAASLSTLVVSWKDAAEMKLEVCRAARVMPCRICSLVAGTVSRTTIGLRSRRFRAEFSSRRRRAVIIWPAWMVSLSPGSITNFLPQMRSFSSMKSRLSTIWLSRNVVSPGSRIFTLRIIWRTITSKCLSLIFTPCMRYTSCTSLTIYSCTAVGPMILRMSAGVMAPSERGVPART